MFCQSRLWPQIMGNFLVADWESHHLGQGRTWATLSTCHAYIMLGNGEGSLREEPVPKELGRQTKQLKPPGGPMWGQLADLGHRDGGR